MKLVYIYIYIYIYIYSTCFHFYAVQDVCNKACPISNEMGEACSMCGGEVHAGF